MKFRYLSNVPVFIGADPGFLERGFRCIKEGDGFALLIYLIFLKYPMKME